MEIIKKMNKGILAILSFVCTLAFTCSGIAYAQAGSFSVSPMFQNVSLVPGEEYRGTFSIVNPNKNDTDFKYKLSIQPFTVDQEHEVVLDNNGDYNQMTKWLSIESTDGIISPNSTKEIKFVINVPIDAPAGGQYAAILVSSDNTGSMEGAVNITNNYQITHLIYADVAGETIRKGEIDDVNVPGFLFSGNISGSARITNQGNVHSRSTNILQVFPLFSDEEVFTNEENPDTTFIMPSSTRLSSLEWQETPSIGIFHVIYNVEFEGVNQKVDKMVIVCPLWLLFIIVAIIFLIIFKILSGKKEKK